jgi:hypothetical protein
MGSTFSNIAAAGKFNRAKGTRGLENNSEVSWRIYYCSAHVYVRSFPVTGEKLSIIFEIMLTGEKKGDIISFTAREQAGQRLKTQAVDQRVEAL